MGIFNKTVDGKHEWYNYVFDEGEHITSVWVEEGCLVCNACESTCPDVFYVGNDSCVVKNESRVDGLTSDNRRERSKLQVLVSEKMSEEILEAYEGCHTSVIRISTNLCDDIENLKVDLVNRPPCSGCETPSKADSDE